jgi:hypothetical protein
MAAGTSPALGATVTPSLDDDRSMGEIIANLIPGEDNVIPNNIDLYLGTHYSVRKKDDGKLLYSWGQAVKKPTDIRFVAHLPLPDTWKTAEGKGLKVTKAQLRVKHSITNNPNDQIRPEDWENEGATGLIPEYEVAEDGTWQSTRDCYEGGRATSSPQERSCVIRDSQSLGRCPAIWPADTATPGTPPSTAIRSHGRTRRQTGTWLAARPPTTVSGS